MHNKTGWIVWFIVTLFVIYAFSLNTAAAVFAPAIKSSLNLKTNMEASIAVGAFIIGFACMQIPAGYLLDRFNAKYVVSVGIFLLALGNLLISVANNLVLFSLSNLLQGIGGSFAFVAAGVLIAQWFPSKLFPILFGLTQTLSCVLSGILHYLFVYAMQFISWNVLYRDLAVFGFILLILSIFGVKSPNNYVIKTTISLKKSLLSVFQNKQILLSTVAAATSFGVLLAYGSFWYADIQNFYAVKSSDALVVSALIFAGIGFGTPIWGWISNVVKSRKFIIHMTLVSGSMMLLLSIYLPHFNLLSLIISEILAFLTGFLLSGSMLFYTVVSEISSNNTRGLGLSVINTGVFLFNTLLLIIPYLFITDASKFFFTYLWILPFCVLISILLIYFLKESYSSATGDRHEQP